MAKLNRWQGETLKALQAMAKEPGRATPEPEGGVLLSFPYPARRGEPSGLRAEPVWTALERKGLAQSFWPLAIVLTPAGLAAEV